MSSPQLLLSRCWTGNLPLRIHRPDTAPIVFSITPACFTPRVQPDGICSRFSPPPPLGVGWRDCGNRLLTSGGREPRRHCRSYSSQTDQEVDS